MTVITIHRGEVQQIKRLITVHFNRRGNLHGLFTESWQPVVQIVFGGGEKSRERCARSLLEYHGLIKLGEWLLEDKNIDDASREPSRDVCLLFNDEGEVQQAMVDNEAVELEILEGQSSFRNSESITNMLKEYTGVDSSLIKEIERESEERQQHISQWYTTEKGTEIMKELFKRAPEHKFKVQTVTRDTETEDITMVLEDKQMTVPLYFPNDFPDSDPIVYIPNSKEYIHIDKTDPLEITDMLFQLLRILIDVQTEKRKIEIQGSNSAKENNTDDKSSKDTPIQQDSIESPNEPNIDDKSSKDAPFQPNSSESPNEANIDDKSSKDSPIRQDARENPNEPNSDDKSSQDSPIRPDARENPREANDANTDDKSSKNAQIQPASSENPNESNTDDKSSQDSPIRPDARESPSEASTDDKSSKDAQIQPDSSENPNERNTDDKSSQGSPIRPDTGENPSEASTDDKSSEDSPIRPDTKEKPNEPNTDDKSSEMRRDNNDQEMEQITVKKATEVDEIQQTDESNMEVEENLSSDEAMDTSF